MRLLYNIKLHQKALTILEMIEKCDRIIADSKSFMTRYDAPWFSFTRPMYQKTIDKHIAVKQRLIIYYSDVMRRLVEPAISNAIDLGTIVITENGYAHAL